MQIQNTRYICMDRIQDLIHNIRFCALGKEWKVEQRKKECTGHQPQKCMGWWSMGYTKLIGKHPNQQAKKSEKPMKPLPKN